MYEPLTDAQRKLVEDNHNLIYFYAHKKGLPIDEYYDLLAIGLCVAAKVFQEGKYSFSSLAMLKMQWILGRYWTHENRASNIPKNQVFSYNKPIKKGFDTFMFETIGDNSSMYINMVQNIMIDEFIETLSGKEKEIIIQMLNGKTQIDIANSMGVKKQNVNYYVSMIRKKWNGYVQGDA